MLGHLLTGKYGLDFLLGCLGNSESLWEMLSCENYTFFC